MKSVFCKKSPSERFADAVGIARLQFADGKMTGAAVAMTGMDPVVIGWRRFDPERVPMTDDSLFDVASVTKSLVAAACARLYEAGRLDPDAPFTEYIPEHAVKGRFCITVADLATHSSGFANMDYLGALVSGEDRENYLRRLYAWLPAHKRHQFYDYRCYNYILLGHIVERITGSRLDEACADLVFKPLGMSDTRWGPLPGNGKTVQLDGRFVNTPNGCGVINDERARICPFPIGNAGVFSTIKDLMTFADDLATRRSFGAPYYRLLQSPRFTGRIFKRQGAKTRSFGFDITPEPGIPGLSSRAIRHSGYTGQTIAADPETETTGVVLTARSCPHPDGIKNRNAILAAMF